MFGGFNPKLIFVICFKLMFLMCFVVSDGEHTF